MKRCLLLLVLILESVLLSFGQNNVFVLVDVSGSRKNDPVKMDAKQFVLDLVMGTYSANGWTPNNVTDQAIQDIVASKNTNALVSRGSSYCIMPFGNLNTYNDFHLDQCKTGPTDFKAAYQQHYPTTFSDNLTYIQIAEAFTVSLAKSYGLNEYYMFVVTDNLGDQDDSDSKNRYNDAQKKLMLEWNNSVSSTARNIATFTKADYYVIVMKVEKVQGSSMPTQPGIKPPPLIVNPADSMAAIMISSPKGKKNKEAELNAESIVVSWACKNCPVGGKFQVMVMEYDGGKHRETKKDIQGNSCALNLPNGKFKITVSSSNFTSKSDTTFVYVSTGGGLWWVILLLLLAAGSVGYWLWSRRRPPGANEQATTPSREGLFTQRSSPSSGSSANTNSGSDGGYW